MFTKYGFDTLIISLIVAFILIAVGLYVKVPALKIIVIICGVAIMIFSLNFFRDPNRLTPERSDILVSPADGKVLVMKKVFDDRFIHSDVNQISIFMSPLDVHVNRIPIDGKIDYLKYVNGKFLTAFNEKADTENERSEIGITSKYGKVLFTQVAGFVARRIVYNLNVGDSVKIGERFGMIKFGSRVDVLVPPNWQIKVKEGDVVKAGETILCEINNEKI